MRFIVLIVLMFVFIIQACNKKNPNNIDNKSKKSNVLIKKENKSDKNSNKKDPKSDILIKKEMIYGTWKYDLKIPVNTEKLFQKEAKEIPKSANIKMLIEIKGTVIYDESGINNYSAIMSVKIEAKNNGVTIALEAKFKFYSSNKWRLNKNNEIVETSIDTKVTPENELAKEIIKEEPQFLDSFLKGELSKDKIISISKNMMELQFVDIDNENDDDEFSKEFKEKLKNLKYKLIRVK